jgi:hypothetical protein
MAQTSYSTTMVKAFAGMLADTGGNDVASAVQSEASLEVPFGGFVAFGASDGAAILPAASSAKLLGCLVHDHTYEPGTNMGTVGVKPKNMLSVLRKGRIWVTPETAVAPGDRLHVRYAAGAGGSQLGACRNAAVASETLDCTTQGVFLTTASAGQLAILEIDMTNEP